MKTILTRSPQRAARFITEGEVVAFPTETVYGLGADALNVKAIAKVFAAKRRPADNPLIAHIADMSQINLLTTKVTSEAEKFIEAFFPGPLTLVLPKRKSVPDIASAGLDTIGVRMPRHPAAQEFLRACGVPVVAPSANLSGKPSPTTWQAARDDMDGRISCILKGDQTEVGLESTVVDCTAQGPVLLRAGAITLEELRQIVPATRLRTDGATEARSPGLKHRHYSPTARVFVVAQSACVAPAPDAAYIGLDAPPPPAARIFSRVLVCRNVEEYARSLFLFFRRCDAAGVKTIYCQSVEEAGLGLALMDRINRSARR
ncbi:MAG TPA: L-threonylcarbamoyladenylate synthase [Pyrinomonadaceae bacterium]|jgi:L-threonylcarbamoyladenylate synthase|nr:L-threonylcarbamoyladenylate synthase [Pyrinomonadaceae bacterium]